MTVQRSSLRAVSFLAAGLWLAAIHPALAAADQPQRGPEQRTRLVFQVEAPSDADQITPDLMKATAHVVRKRVDALLAGASVQTIPGNRIEVVIPTTDSELVKRVNEFVPRPGTLEFAYLANTRDHAAVIAAAQNVASEYRDADGRLVAEWLAPAQKNGAPRELHHGGDISTREVDRGGRSVIEFLVVYEPEERRVTGKYLARVERSRDNDGRPAIDLKLNRHGGKLMRGLTASGIPDQDGFQRRLAIILDGRIHQAPSVHSTVGDRVQITGLDQNEAGELIAALRLGRLPLPIKSEPVVKETVAANSQ